MNDYISIVMGLCLAGIGGELFVRGTEGLARWWRIPSGVVAATLAAFATSSPELSVSVNAALAGGPQIALGDALGSNVVNVALILAIALLLTEVRSSQAGLSRDYLFALSAPLVTGVLAVDGTIARLDAMVMFGLFAAWMALSAVETRRYRSGQVPEDGSVNKFGIILTGMAGLGFLLIAGNLIVNGASGIAQALGIQAFVIGAVIVAIGTSVPELATVVIAGLRGKYEIGLGTVLGSNIFNGLFVVPVAASILPIEIRLQDIALTLAVGIASIALARPSTDGRIARIRAIPLILLYAAYIAAMLFG